MAIGVKYHDINKAFFLGEILHTKLTELDKEMVNV